MSKGIFYRKNTTSKYNYGFSTIARSIYFGNAKVTKIFYGTTQIYQDISSTTTYNLNSVNFNTGGYAVTCRISRSRGYMTDVATVYYHYWLSDSTGNYDEGYGQASFSTSSQTLYLNLGDNSQIGNTESAGIEVIAVDDTKGGMNTGVLRQTV